MSQVRCCMYRERHYVKGCGWGIASQRLRGFVLDWMCQRTKAMGCGFCALEAGEGARYVRAGRAGDARRGGSCNGLAWHSHGPDWQSSFWLQRETRARSGTLAWLEVHACGCHRLASLGPLMEASPFPHRLKLLSMLTHTLSLAQRGPRRVGGRPWLATGKARLCSGQQGILVDSFEGPFQRLIPGNAYTWKQEQGLEEESVNRTSPRQKKKGCKGRRRDAVRSLAIRTYSKLERKRSRRWCGSGDADA